MTKIQIKEYNCESSEEVIRDATVEEIAQIELDKAESATRQAEAEAKAQAKADLLAKLGISEEEAKLLLS